VSRKTIALGPETLKLLDLDQLAALIGGSFGNQKERPPQESAAVPPRLHIPGTRLMRWCGCDVEAWLPFAAICRRAGD
jgi:hypothetical protein